MTILVKENFSKNQDGKKFQFNGFLQLGYMDYDIIKKSVDEFIVKDDINQDVRFTREEVLRLFQVSSTELDELEVEPNQEQDTEIITKDDVIRYMTTYAMQEHVSIEESQLIAEFWGVLEGKLPDKNSISGIYIRSLNNILSDVTKRLQYAVEKTSKGQESIRQPILFSIGALKSIVTLLTELSDSQENNKSN